MASCLTLDPHLGKRCLSIGNCFYFTCSKVPIKSLELPGKSDFLKRQSATVGSISSAALMGRAWQYTTVDPRTIQSGLELVVGVCGVEAIQW